MGIPKSALHITAIVAALAVFGVVGAKFAGQRVEDATFERMETVWPDFAAMPKADQTFLIQPSLNCQLVRRPALRSEVLACLRDGAGQAGAAAPPRLARLLPPGVQG